MKKCCGSKGKIKKESLHLSVTVLANVLIVGEENKFMIFNPCDDAESPLPGNHCLFKIFSAKAAL